MKKYEIEVFKIIVIIIAGYNLNNFTDNIISRS